MLTLLTNISALKNFFCTFQLKRHSSSIGDGGSGTVLGWGAFFKKIGALSPYFFIGGPKGPQFLLLGLSALVFLFVSPPGPASMHTNLCS